MLRTSPRCALCIGHPGHELRVYGWMTQNKPLVDVLTDGSGPDRAPRFESTRRLVGEAGGRPGFLSGAFSDRAFYQMILAADPEPFIELARRLAEQWRTEQIEVVAGDMLEGFSPTHDICRVLINAAVLKLAREGLILTNLEFPLEAMRPAIPEPGTLILRLDDAAFAKKRAAATEAYPALTGEVDRLISQYGVEAFSVEMLVPVPGRTGLTWDHPEPPYYERYGRQQVAAGHYQDLITFADHFQPLAQALYDWADADGA